MLFNSYTFIFAFLPIALLGFFGLSRLRWTKGAIVWMAIASLFFYAYWNPAYLLLLLVSISVNYAIGQQLDKCLRASFSAKVLLILGITFNLALLGYYKYARFFVSSLNDIFHHNLPIPEIILPLAISFYSFTQIAYLVDAYRGETQSSNYDFSTYALFVSFYPQLIAGPILRHDELIPQFRNFKSFIFSHKNFALGLSLFILGLAKKLLIADNLSPWVAPVFDHAVEVKFLEAWIGALSYTFQLYFDFSGYSDMAIGLGWMVNINLPINFNSPYKATSIGDFWRRWHITLSAFLRDYLYIPLGGNKRGELRRYVNLLLTMLLGGLWHGAGWHYVVWGGMHGSFLVVDRAWRKLGISLPKCLAWLITFVAVIASWVLFRAHNLGDGVEILQAMSGLKAIELPMAYQGTFGWLSGFGVQFLKPGSFPYLPPTYLERVWLALGTLFVAVIFFPNTQEILRRLQPNLWWALGIGILASFCFVSLNQVSEFLYFQF